MPVVTEDRPIDAVREEVIDQLIVNYSHGHLSLDAFERRLDQAMASDNHLDLLALTADLDMEADSDYADRKQQDLGIHYNTQDAVDKDYIIDIFGGCNRSGTWQVAREIRMFCLFGGNELDFTNARFSHPVTRIKVFSLFGGSSIYVPENLNVHSKAFCIFGGIGNDANSIHVPQGPTLIIEGFIIFSGIGIKIRRTLKERFMEFADGLKRLLS